MPAVLVHGVPETPAIWNTLRSQLSRDDVVAVQLPGFGCPRPEGFGATKEEYVAWLIAELERIAADGPVDLVGHDWGGGFVVRLVSLRADLVSTWITDAAGIGHPDFEWHEFAKLWQTPGEGESFWEQQLALSTEERSGVFEISGVPHDEAVDLASPVDETMADSILRLYRSAVGVGSEWAPGFSNIAARGLVLVPSDDPFLNADHARKAAARAGADVAELSGVGHWWMLQDPKQGAAVLQAFWAREG
jgi:pimeloyl-ACP methyl ester carboxylesterase